MDAARDSPGMRRSASEAMDAHHPGDTKFDAVAVTSHDHSGVTTINTGQHVNLGSRDYEASQARLPKA